jgi:trehalose 6-phosphate phosphatase
VATGAAPAGGDRLAPWLRRPDRAGLLTDFDGTLSPIVDDPSAAAPLAGAARTLARLARRYAQVAVVSGRPVAYLAQRLGTTSGLILVGLYGLERIKDGVVEELPEAGRWRSVVDRVATAAEQASPAGVHIERKGLSVVLHTRTAPETSHWVEIWAARAAGATGLVAHPGKRSIELRPPVKADKGTVVEELAQGLDAVCFLGDDRGDLPAFAALGRLAHRGIHTLAVAVESDESPPELLDAADLVVAGPQGALAFLEALAGDSRC